MVGVGETSALEALHVESSSKTWKGQVSGGPFAVERCLQVTRSWPRVQVRKDLLMEYVPCKDEGCASATCLSQGTLLEVEVHWIMMLAVDWCVSRGA